MCIHAHSPGGWRDPVLQELLGENNPATVVTMSFLDKTRTQLFEEYGLAEVGSDPSGGTLLDLSTPRTPQALASTIPRGSCRCLGTGRPTRPLRGEQWPTEPPTCTSTLGATLPAWPAG